MAAIMPSSMPPPPPPATVTAPLQPGYQGPVAAAGAVAAAQSHGSGSSSIGTFFGMLAAVLVLTLLSCVIGRVCARHAAGPDERYDCATLARRWCFWGRPPRRVVRRQEAKPSPPVVVEEVPAAALPPPEP